MCQTFWDSFNAAVQSKLGYLLSEPLLTHSHNSTVSLFHVSTQPVKDVRNVEAAGTPLTVSKNLEALLNEFKQEVLHLISYTI